MNAPRKKYHKIQTRKALLWRGAYPDQDFCEFDRWMMETFHVCEQTCHNWRIKHGLTGLDPKTFNKPIAEPQDAKNAPAPTQIPSDPSEARLAHIRELERLATTASRPQDRLHARRELARVQGWYRDDVQDALNKKTAAQESEIAKCKRLARELREALGLSMEGLPPDLVFRLSRETALVPHR
jgi:hypothetical protein